MIDFTTVIVVDEGHLEQLRIVWPTWVKFRAEIMSQPIIVITDGPMDGQLDFIFKDANAGIVFGYVRGGGGMGHRHKMLSAFFDGVDRYVTTEWWLKIDTDAIAKYRTDDGWINDDWFSDDPAIIAPAWGYSKPPDIMERLDDWGDTIPELKDLPRLELHPKPGSGLVRHPRITSWCSFYNTAWTRKVYSLYDGPVMPVESQDSFAWYCAKRAGDEIRRIGMKQFGWDHVLRTSKLRKLAKEALCLAE